MNVDKYGRTHLEKGTMYVIGNFRINLLETNDLEIDAVDAAITVRSRYANSLRVEAIKN